MINQWRFISSLIILVGMIASGVDGRVLADDEQPPLATCAGTDWQVGTTIYSDFEVDHFARVYHVYIPEGYDGVTPLPLVMSLHGTVSSASEQQEKTGWDDVADAENLIVVYPQGRRSVFFNWAWNAGAGMAGDDRTATNNLGETVEIDDVSFFNALLDHLLDTFCINPNQVYITGFSNGGGMTDHLACALSDRITAIGTVAGAYTAIPNGCNPTHPMPVITFQGKQDRIVNYAGSVSHGLQGVESWAEDWAKRNRCDDERVAIDYPADSVEAYRYTHCDEDADVQVYSLDQTGHTWAGGGWGDSLLLGKTNTDIHASETMWEFFSQYERNSDQ
jgi:polyhydroxybutyrate depolymerase